MRGRAIADAFRRFRPRRMAWCLAPLVPMLNAAVANGADACTLTWDCIGDALANCRTAQHRKLVSMRRIIVLGLLAAAALNGYAAKADPITVPPAVLATPIGGFPLPPYDCNCYANLYLLASLGSPASGSEAGISESEAGYSHVLGQDIAEYLISGDSHVQYDVMVTGVDTAVPYTVSGLATVSVTGPGTATANVNFAHIQLADLSCSGNDCAGETTRFNQQVSLAPNTLYEMVLLTSVLNGDDYDTWQMTALADPTFTLDPSYTGPTPTLLFSTPVNPVSIDETVGTPPARALEPPASSTFVLSSVLVLILRRYRAKGGDQAARRNGRLA
jgi:hypothetical protein